MRRGNQWSTRDVQMTGSSVDTCSPIASDILSFEFLVMRSWVFKVDTKILDLKDKWHISQKYYYKSFYSTSLSDFIVIVYILGSFEMFLNVPWYIEVFFQWNSSARILSYAYSWYKNLELKTYKYRSYCGMICVRLKRSN